MAFGPRPKDFTDAGEDFTIIRQVDHQLGIHPFTDDPEANIRWRRNDVTPNESDLSGC